MPTRWHDIDEWYPVFKLVLTENEAYFQNKAEFSDEEIAFIDKAFDAFWDAQAMIKERFEQ